ncbi:MAG: right-handed parallel beta-helix repeat-containing protein, partial [candidate division Zixibacteria bacterium]|nr:right-handed parallel beta-helix repeat-containing protein [candidate division Zixibacteria bacterium]
LLSLQSHHQRQQYQRKFSFLRRRRIACLNNSNPIISNNTISENSANAGGGIACLNNSNPIISNNTISENAASFGGGGILCQLSSPTIRNNTISENATSFGGGGIGCATSDPTISNNTISGNSAGFGGGIRCQNSSPAIINNTISGNSATIGSGLFLSNSSSPSVENTVIAFNSGPHIVCGDETSVPTLSCCDVFGNEGGDWVGCIAGQEGINGNFSLDPLFCDTATADYHIDQYSPCVPPFSSCGVLIGALGVGCGDEYLCADANGDSLINVDDVDFLMNFYFYGGATPFPYLASDLNCDGSVNIADITYLAAYINGTGAPPCCQQ